MGQTSPIVPETIQGYCGNSIKIYLWTWTTFGIVVTNVEGNISDNQATFNFTGYQSFPAPLNVYFNASVTLTAIPTNINPELCIMNAEPSVLYSTDFWLCSGISAHLFDNSGYPFEYCGSGASMLFTIENPIDNVRFVKFQWDEENDSGYKLIDLGNPVEVNFNGNSSGVILAWDPSNCSKDMDTLIQVRAEGFGLTGVQTVELINLIPHHFDVTPNTDVIFAGESAQITAIAKNIDNEEQQMDGQLLVTYLDMYNIGSFIVDSDTIPGQITVPYTKAKSGGVKYYAPNNVSNNISSKQAWIFVFREGHLGNRGYGVGLVNIIPLCPVVELAKEEIALGEKVAINIMGKNREKSVSYPEDQVFKIWINTDVSYGKLRSVKTEDTGSVLFGRQPFEFIAADSINEDSAVVKIEVQVNSGDMAGLIQDVQKRDYTLTSRIDDEATSIW